MKLQFENKKSLRINGKTHQHKLKNDGNSNSRSGNGRFKNTILIALLRDDCEKRRVFGHILSANVMYK